MTMTWLQNAPVSATTQPGLKVVCLKCSAMVEYARAIIDVDGPAFKAYYHPNHAPKIICSTCGRLDHSTDSHDKVWGWNAETHRYE